MKSFFLIFTLLTLLSFQVFSQPNLSNSDLLNIDDETMDYLYSKAVRLSKIKSFPLSEMPPIFKVSKERLNQIVCPESPDSCRNLAAVFDDLKYRILILDDLDISTNFDVFNYSFLIHEIIHALQYRARGAEIFNGCDAVYETEKEAYTAQDIYLKEEGDFFRASIALRSFYCEEDLAKVDYLKSKAIWDKRNSSGVWKL